MRRGGRAPEVEPGKEPVSVEMGGRVTEGEALWLRWKFGREIGPRERRDAPDGRGAIRFGGDWSDETISALPSRDRDMRNWDDWELGGGSTGVDELPEDAKDSSLDS